MVPLPDIGRSESAYASKVEVNVAFGSWLCFFTQPGSDPPVTIHRRARPVYLQQRKDLTRCAAGFRLMPERGHRLRGSRTVLRVLHREGAKSFGRVGLKMRLPSK